MVDEESKSTTDKPEEKPTTDAESISAKSNGSSPANASASDKESAENNSGKLADIGADADLSSLSTKERQQIHISKILDEVLELPEPPKGGSKYKHPMYLDLILAAGLLVAMGGFTIGLFKIYITHSAQDNIAQHNYKAAISILRGSPVPDFFAVPGSSPQELLNKALYLDAMEKLDANPEDQSALHELQKITKNSTFFETAQDILKDKYKPSRMLEGGASHDATLDPNLKKLQGADPQIQNSSDQVSTDEASSDQSSSDQATSDQSNSDQSTSGQSASDQSNSGSSSSNQ